MAAELEAVAEVGVGVVVVVVVAAVVMVVAAMCPGGGGGRGQRWLEQVACPVRKLARSTRVRSSGLGSVTRLLSFPTDLLTDSTFTGDPTFTGDSTVVFQHF